MNQKEITKFVDELSKTKNRNIVIVDFANVDKWEEKLGWPVGIKQLAQLIKHFAYGNRSLRRFYYCGDFGPNERSTRLKPWSKTMLNSANINNFEIITKRVKYIPDPKYETGYVKKGNLDIEMAVDMIRMVEDYDKVILFSGDGDLECVLRYLRERYSKEIFVFGARDHTGKELVDARAEGIIKNLLFVEDFEYRLNFRRFYPN